MRRAVTSAFTRASLLFARPAESRMECWRGEIWMTKEGIPMCALASDQGGCNWCEVTVTQPCP
ncbi:MAG TPA: hypothetical protein VEK79_03380 [Thermoanaerobaculia bacterium]|nr:hypothetical protein [Thermoanaerobaculia bacterium]